MDTSANDGSRELCGQAQRGDLAAATQLVTLHYQRVYAFLRRLCASDDDAAELTQRTFARAWVALGNYKGRSSFSTWIHGVARHVYLDWRRRPERGEALSESWWERCAAEGGTPFEDAAQRDQAALVHGLVAGLAQEKREVIHLHYYQGLTLEETAEVLGVAVSTVKYRLRTAMELLRHRAGKHEGEVSNRKD